MTSKSDLLTIGMILDWAREVHPVDCPAHLLRDGWDSLQKLGCFVHDDEPELIIDGAMEMLAVVVQLSLFHDYGWSRLIDGMRRANPAPSRRSGFGAVVMTFGNLYRIVNVPGYEFQWPSLLQAFVYAVAELCLAEGVPVMKRLEGHIISRAAKSRSVNRPIFNLDAKPGDVM